MSTYMEQRGEYLEHYGTKGMKWGVRKQKKTLARAEINRQKAKISKEFNKGAASSNDAARQASVKKVNELGKKLRNDPNVTLASKTTTGEKAVHVLLFGPLALGTIPIHSAMRKQSIKSVSKFAETVDTRDMPKPKK